MNGQTMDASQGLSSAVNIIQRFGRKLPEMNYLAIDAVRKIEDAKDAFLTHIENLEKGNGS